MCTLYPLPPRSGGKGRREQRERRVGGAHKGSSSMARASKSAPHPWPLPTARRARGWEGNRLSLSQRVFCLRAASSERIGPETLVRWASRALFVSFATGKQRSKKAKKEKEAERRKTHSSNRRIRRCSARLAGRARLPAFHRGSRRRDCSSPRLSVRPCFLGFGRSVRSQSSLQPGSENLAPLHGRYPRRKNKNLSQSSEAPRAPVIVPAG
jgi:hypothetical protein